MAYIRKTQDEYQIWGNNGYGSEEYSAYDNRKEALADLREYRRDGTGTTYWIKKVRVKIEQSATVQEDSSMSTKQTHKRYTIQEIKRINTEKGYFFFERGTMRFFHNTMRDFRVRHIDGKVYVINTMGGAVHLFDPETGDTRYISNDAEIPEQIDRDDLARWEARRLAASTFRWG